MITKVLSQISNENEMANILKCIFTPKELKEVENRLQIFQMLEKKLPQREIAESLGVGISTVTRGAQAHRAAGFKTLKPYL